MTFLTNTNGNAVRFLLDDNKMDDALLPFQKKKSFSMKEFSCKHYLTQQVDSRCVIFLFYLLWQTHELPTVTVVSSPSQPALLFSATYVSLPVFVHAAFDSDISDCSFLFWFVLSCSFFLLLLFLFFPEDCEHTERKSNLKVWEYEPSVVDGRA